MLDDLVASCRQFPGSDLTTASARMRALLPAVRRLRLATVDVPWGRYLAHDEGSFNVQIDVFSPDYVGGVHAHRTWGIFFVLRGGLWAEDWAEGPTGLAPVREAWIGAGGCACFAPPASDWHRVATGSGQQTVSIHVYGPGFDLDEGEGLDAAGTVRRYRRSAWGDPAALLPLFA